MAHRTKVNGTDYSIVGGMTKINGTDYNIISGMTKINGTDYALEFPKEQEPVPDGKLSVTIGVFDPSCGEITVNGESLSINTEGVYSYEPGATVSVTAHGANIVLNGEKLLAADQSNGWCPNYTFTLTTNVTLYSNYENGVAVYIETE